MNDTAFDATPQSPHILWYLVTEVLRAEVRIENRPGMIAQLKPHGGLQAIKHFRSFAISTP